MRRLNTNGGYAITTALESTGKLTAYEFALAAAELAANTRCEDVILLDLRGRSPITEYFLIATGSSARQMRTVADELSDMGKRRGFRPISTGGYDSARWIVIDFVNAVVHVFDADSRDFYDLELLWGDSPRINWRKELGLPEVAMIRNEEEMRRRKEARALAAQQAAAAEQRHMEGQDDQDDDDDEDMDDAGENEPSVVVELPDESTGSNSVEFVEIDSPNKRRDKRSAAFPVTLKEEDAESDMSRLHPVEKKSLDEDVHERFAEEKADVDPEARSEEDLSDERIVSIPMGGVSAGMSSTTIIEDDEDQQRDSIELDDAGSNREDVPQTRAKSRAKPIMAAPATKAKSKVKPKAKAKAKAKPKAKSIKKDKPKLKAKAQVKVKTKPQPNVKAKAKPKAKVKIKAKPKATKKKSAPAKKKAPKKAKPNKLKR